MTYAKGRSVIHAADRQARQPTRRRGWRQGPRRRGGSRSRVCTRIWAPLRGATFSGVRISSTSGCLSLHSVRMGSRGHGHSPWTRACAKISRRCGGASAAMAHRSTRAPPQPGQVPAPLAGDIRPLGNHLRGAAGRGTSRWRPPMTATPADWPPGGRPAAPATPRSRCRPPGANACAHRPTSPRSRASSAMCEYGIASAAAPPAGADHSAIGTSSVRPRRRGTAHRSTASPPERSPL